MNTHKTIESVEKLSFLGLEVRKEKKTIALCHGVFDLLHPGHFEHFRAASELADIVVVSVTSDKYVNKGPGRPVFNLQTRMKTLSYLNTIDYVVASDFSDASQVLHALKPNFYVKGNDYSDLSSDVTGKIEVEAQIVEAHGGQLVFTNEITSSSTSLINEFMSSFEPEVKNWIQDFKQKHSIDEINSYLNRISELNVGLLGEVIIDVYSDCKALAKSSKDPLLAFHLGETRVYPGGILAIENNCKSWASKVSLFTAVGEDFTSRDLFKNMSVEKENWSVFKSTQNPTIVKHRYVDIDSNTRLFETYEYSQNDYDEKTLSNLQRELKNQELELDLLIVADYGHGLMTKKLVNEITNLIPFIAVNTQANAGNRGFNTITKYQRADLISLNGSELQLELRDTTPNYAKIVPQYMQKMQASFAVLTLGAGGLMVFDKSGDSTLVPAFATKVVDKVGAGDSVLSIASLLARVHAPISIIGFIASIVAAHEVGQLGHKSSLSKVDLKKTVKGMLG